MVSIEEFEGDCCNGCDDYGFCAVPCKQLYKEYAQYLIGELSVSN